jgi:hypothetical protein
LQIYFSDKVIQNASAEKMPISDKGKAIFKKIVKTNEDNIIIPGISYIDEARELFSGTYLYKLTISPSNGEKEIIQQKIMQLIK